MTPNRTYQATVEALESVLPPRVVSLVLREGLVEVGRTPADLEATQVETILTGAAFRRLQTTMPVDQARTTIEAFLASIRAAVADEAAERASQADADASHADDEGTDVAGDADAEARIDGLREALRPLNLYFDWPEVRKLRAQLQVAEEELAARTDPSATLDDADAQLAVVRQKLEDRLVLQAKELAALEEALEVVASLGGPRVRRLEALIGQIRHAQRARELADAEVERAAGIARDLRKLMESSVARALEPSGGDAASDAEGRAPAPVPAAATADAVTEDAEGDDADHDGDLPGVTIDLSALPEEVGDRVRQVDLEGERRQLDALAAQHAELLRYLPELAEPVAAAAAELDGARPLGDALDELRTTLEAASETQRRHVEFELMSIDADLARHPDDDDGSLERALRVALDVAASGVPPHADVVTLRALHAALLERAEARERRDDERRAHDERRREQQQALLVRMRRAVARAPSETGGHLDDARQALRDAVAALEAAEREGRVDDDVVGAAHTVEQRWERALASRASDHDERQRAQLRALDARLGALPDLATVAERRDRIRGDVRQALDEGRPNDGLVTTLTSLVDQLHAAAVDATSRQLDALGQEAGDAAAPEVLSAFQRAARLLEAGQFPDVGAIRRLVAEQRERRRDDEQRRWQQLARASQRLEGAGVASSARLLGLVEAARAALASGHGSAAALAAAETAVADVEREARARLDGFGPRLDAALATLARVERLNNDEVATVRRVLRHLDSQRDALERVSVGLQHQLDRSLQEAEAILPGLEEAFEATREIADRLVEGNLFDDMLGFFDDLAEAPTTPAGPAAWRESEALQALMAGFRGLDDVDAAAVVSGDGRVRAGDVGDLDPVRVADALRTAGGGWASLGAALDDRAPELVDLALGSRHALLTPVGAEAYALVLVRSDGAISALASRLREQRPALLEAVAAAS